METTVNKKKSNMTMWIAIVLVAFFAYFLGVSNRNVLGVKNTPSNESSTSMSASACSSLLESFKKSQTLTPTDFGSKITSYIQYCYPITGAGSLGGAGLLINIGGGDGFSTYYMLCNTPYGYKNKIYCEPQIEYFGYIQNGPLGTITCWINNTRCNFFSDAQSINEPTPPTNQPIVFHVGYGDSKKFLNCTPVANPTSYPAFALGISPTPTPEPPTYHYSCQLY